MLCKKKREKTGSRVTLRIPGMTTLGLADPYLTILMYITPPLAAPK